MNLTEQEQAIVQNYVDKFVAPTIPGTPGAAFAEHVRVWLKDTLVAHRKSVLEEIMKEVEPLFKNTGEGRDVDEMAQIFGANNVLYTLKQHLQALTPQEGNTN